MELPIGAFFESLVRGLQDNFGAFFDATSETIDFAITLLERTLSLDTTAWYAAPSIFVLIGLLVFGISRRHMARGPALGIGIASIVLLGVSQVWRTQLIHQTVAPEQAIALAAEVRAFNASFAEAAPPELARDGDRVLRRIASRFDSIDSERSKVSLLGDRTFERYTVLRSAVRDLDNAALSAQFKPLDSALKQFAPNRLGWYQWLVVSTLLTLLAYLCASLGLAIFTFVGFALIMNMGFWSYTTDTLALVLSATGFALLLGVPLGIAAAANQTVDKVLRPILDFMQTMPAFVYLIPAVLLFGLGKVPGAMATLIFAMPPAVRLTSLGIRSVPTEVVEAAQSFGSTPMQLLFKAQLPIALPTILAGLNQTIMLALSMVVIGGMIGAGGLGEIVLSGITQLKIGLGFESGLSVVILAIFLDRLTQALGSYESKS